MIKMLGMPNVALVYIFMVDLYTENYIHMYVVYIGLSAICNLSTCSKFRRRLFIDVGSIINWAICCAEP